MPSPSTSQKSAHSTAHCSHSRYLDVRNPRVSVLVEKVFAQGESFWWSWAERIAGCEDVAEAATILVRVLRTVDGE